MNREQPPVNGGLPLGQPEPGCRFNGKLIREMTDEELKESVQLARVQLQQLQSSMQSAVMDHATFMAVANVLAFEEERRSKSLIVPRVFS